MTGKKSGCLHTHTDFCDGKNTVEDYCIAAYGKGFHSLGFSAHAPVTKKTGFPDPCWREKEQRLDKYIETVNEAKRRWEGRLAVFLGLEVDFIKGLMSPADDDYRQLGLDYIIGSIHFLVPEKGAPFCVDHRTAEFEKCINESYGGDYYTAIESYYNNLESMINAGGFDFIGHPDLIRKNNAQNRFFNENSDFYLKKCESAAIHAGKNKLTIEVNTGGMNRGYIDTTYPSLPLLKMFRENNVAAVINADAHKTDQIDGHYDVAEKTMLEAGYAEAGLFAGKKNGIAEWRFYKL